jgi:hypothetical protein
MTLITFDWYKDQWAETSRALNMIDWLKSQGLKNNQDYCWSIDPQFRRTIFKFFGTNESISSYFRLVWTQ